MSGVVKRKVGAARLSVLSNALLVIVQLTVGLMIGSVSVISVAVDSVMDVIASLIALFSVQVASRPADDEHRYGHGKMESVAALVEGLLVVAAGLWLSVEAVQSMMGDNVQGPMMAGLVVMGLSGVVKFVVAGYMSRVAREEDSLALAAEATNLRADVSTAGAVFAGLVLREVTGLDWVDGAVGLVVSALILRSGARLVRGAVMNLMDAGLPAEEEAEIVRIIEQHSGEFVEFHDLRTRQSGPARYVDFHLVVHGHQPLEEVHRLCDVIEEAIVARFPTGQVLIHPEPCEEGCDYCRGARTRRPVSQAQTVGGRRYRGRGITFRRTLTTQ